MPADGSQVVVWAKDPIAVRRLAVGQQHDVLDISRRAGKQLPRPVDTRLGKGAAVGAEAIDGPLEGGGVIRQLLVGLDNGVVGDHRNVRVAATTVGQQRVDEAVGRLPCLLDTIVVPHAARGVDDEDDVTRLPRVLALHAQGHVPCVDHTRNWRGRLEEHDLARALGMVGPYGGTCWRVASHKLGVQAVAQAIAGAKARRGGCTVVVRKPCGRFGTREVVEVLPLRGIGIIDRTLSVSGVSPLGVGIGPIRGHGLEVRDIRGRLLGRCEGSVGAHLLAIARPVNECVAIGGPGGNRSHIAGISNGKCLSQGVLWIQRAALASRKRDGHCSRRGILSIRPHGGTTCHREACHENDRGQSYPDLGKPLSHHCNLSFGYVLARTPV